MELKNKKGDVTDIITVGFWLLIMGIGIFAVWFMISSLIPRLQETSINDSSASSSALISFQNYGNVTLPSTFLIIFFGLILGVLVSSFFIRTHPIFIPVYILFAVISIIVAVALGNTWGNLKDVQDFQNFVDTNTITNIIDTIMSNLVLVTLFVFILTLIVIFAKPGGSVKTGNEPY